MKILKKIFDFLLSRYFGGALCILIEISLLLVRYVFYYINFVPGRIISYICCAEAILFIINRDENAEFKLPWKDHCCARRIWNVRI